jgi:hypothetical protein
MKSYAKTLTGSVYSIDRRQDAAPADGSSGAPSVESTKREENA